MGRKKAKPRTIKKGVFFRISGCDAPFEPLLLGLVAVLLLWRQAARPAAGMLGAGPAAPAKVPLVSAFRSLAELPGLYPQQPVFSAHPGGLARLASPCTVGGGQLPGEPAARAAMAGTAGQPGLPELTPVAADAFHWRKALKFCGAGQRQRGAGPELPPSTRAAYPHRAGTQLPPSTRAASLFSLPSPVWQPTHFAGGECLDSAGRRRGGGSGRGELACYHSFLSFTGASSPLGA